MKIENNIRLCLVTFPIQERGGYSNHIKNQLKVFEAIASKVLFITGNFPKEDVSEENVSFINISQPITIKKNVLLKIFWHVMMQVKISYLLIKYNRDIDEKIFFLTGTPLFSILTAKLLRKKAILVGPASNYKMAKHSKEKIIYRSGKMLIMYLTFVLEKSCQYLSDEIILESPNLANELNLGRYKNKIFSNGGLFVDTEKFSIKIPMSERENVIGYVGRLSGEKGIMNFVKSIPEILKNQKDLRILICGDGNLKPEIMEYIKNNNLENNVELTGWIPHDLLPAHLNRLKLCILPSYTEALPNIILESFACGTPIIGTPVGGIPDIVIDGKTGFMLENNSSECISKNVLRALSSKNITDISLNSRLLIERDYSFNAAVERYQKIVNDE
jgi:glycosyltransferase involved in cell wall biosynthesis